LQRVASVERALVFGVSSPIALQSSNRMAVIVSLQSMSNRLEFPVCAVKAGTNGLKYNYPTL